MLLPNPAACSVTAHVTHWLCLSALVLFCGNRPGTGTLATLQVASRPSFPVLPFSCMLYCGLHKMVTGGASENRQHLRRQHPDQAETVTAVDVSNSLQQLSGWSGFCGVPQFQTFKYLHLISLANQFSLLSSPGSQRVVSPLVLPAQLACTACCRPLYT